MGNAQGKKGESKVAREGRKHDDKKSEGPGGDVREKYRVDHSELGHGHYGVVRKCQNRTTKEYFAVKTIKKAKVGRLETLKREIEILKTMDHPNIIKLVDVFEDDKYLHLVTELCTGGELFDRIIEKTKSAEGHYSEQDAAVLVKSILSAIEYCHTVHNICHRDLCHIRSALSAREGEASICELRRGQQDLAARLKAAEAGLESLRQQELRGAPGGAVGDVDRAQSRLREQVEMMQGRLDALVETQSQTATALEGLQGWCATELEGLRKLSGHQHTSLVERLNYLGFLGFSAGRRAERPASARAKLGQTSGRPSAREADRPGAEARGAAPHEAPPLGASLCERIDLLEDVVGTLAQEWPGSALAHSRPEPPRSGSAATRRSPPPDGGGDSAQTTVRCAWDEPVPCRLDQMPRPAATRQRSAPSSRGRVDHARASGATSACYGAASARYASRSVPATAPPAPALRAHGSCATAPQKAVRYAAVHESLKLFEGRSGTPQRMPSTLDRASVSYRPCSTPRSWLGLAAR